METESGVIVVEGLRGRLWRPASGAQQTNTGGKRRERKRENGLGRCYQSWDDVLGVGSSPWRSQGPKTRGWLETRTKLSGDEAEAEMKPRRPGPPYEGPHRMLEAVGKGRSELERDCGVRCVAEAKLDVGARTGDRRGRRMVVAKLDVGKADAWLGRVRRRRPMQSSEADANCRGRVELAEATEAEGDLPRPKREMKAEGRGMKQGASLGVRMSSRGETTERRRDLPRPEPEPGPSEAEAESMREDRESPGTPKRKERGRSGGQGVHARGRSKGRDHPR